MEARSPTGTKAAPVLTHKVQWQARATLVEAVGTSRARQSVTLFPEVSGEVEAVLFKTGEAVEADQPLVQLDARDQQLAVELAQVELADAERLYSRYRRSEGAVSRPFGYHQSRCRRAGGPCNGRSELG
jgi:membrane fusion protein (multidrug efflux system)